MATILQYTPGTAATIMLEILSDAGVLEDGYSTPVVSKVILPDLSESMLYPLDMIRITTGIYYHRFILPVGAAAVGTYIVILAYTNAAGDAKNEVVQVVCSAPGGQFSVSPG